SATARNRVVQVLLVAQVLLEQAVLGGLAQLCRGGALHIGLSPLPLAARSTVELCGTGGLSGWRRGGGRGAVRVGGGAAVAGIVGHRGLDGVGDRGRVGRIDAFEGCQELAG